MRLKRMTSAVWAVFMEQATGGDGGASAGGSGGDGAAPAAASAAAASAAGGEAGATGADGKPNTGADGKPAGSEANSDGKAGSDGKPAGEVKAPESYTLKLPEKSALDQADVDEVAAFAKANNLSNEAAQAALEQRHAAAEKVTTAAQTKLTEIKTGWANELKADPELGGANLEANDALATKALQEVFGDDFLKSVKEAGFNLHPGFFRGLVRIGKAMSEDKPLNVPAGGGSAEKRDAASVLYGGGTS